jgi:glucose-1-phosphate thymidylyltransferase
VEAFKAVVLANARPGAGWPSFVRRRAIELVSVANEPIIFHVLDALQDIGIHDAALVVDPQAGEEIREAVRDGSSWGLRVSYIARRDLGLIDALRAAERTLGDSPFVVYPANGILIAPLQPALRHFRRARLGALLGVHGGGKAAATSRNGVELALTRMLDGHSVPIQDGVHVFGPSIHAAARAGVPSWRGRLELADVIHALLQGGERVEAKPMDAWWRYRGRAHELLEANRLLLDRLIDDRADAQVSDSTIEGRVCLSASATVESTTIRGPAIVGPGAQLADAYIGPYTSVGPEALVRGAEIENSIIMTGAAVKDVGARISDSVIGEDVIVSRDFTLPRVLELAVAHGSTAMFG